MYGESGGSSQSEIKGLEAPAAIRKIDDAAAFNAEGSKKMRHNPRR